MTDKRCAACREIKPIDEFPTHHMTLDGHQHSCRLCWGDGFSGRYKPHVCGGEEINPFDGRYTHAVREYFEDQFRRTDSPAEPN